jgi:hypothetical protein
MYYGARYYSPVIGRFVSADTIVPNAANPQAFNRFSYVRNNPLRYTDPTGHYECSDIDCGGNGGVAPAPAPIPPPFRPILSEPLMTPEELAAAQEDLQNAVNPAPEKDRVKCDLASRMLNPCNLNWEEDHDQVQQWLVLYLASGQAGTNQDIFISLFLF